MSIDRNLHDGLLILTLNDPDRRNPLGHAVRRALAETLSEAECNPEVRAVVLTGAGGNFSAGGDIRDQGQTSFAQSRDRFAVIKDLIGRMVHFPKPLIAAVEGWAAGGGFSLALACDTMVAAHDARFIASFAKVGLIPDMGILATLPARIGTGRARQMFQTPAPITARDGHGIGLVDHICAPGQALATATDLARTAMTMAPMPRAFVNDFLARGVDEALEYERQLQPHLIRSADAAEGRAAFFDKRPAAFRGE